MAARVKQTHTHIRFYGYKKYRYIFIKIIICINPIKSYAQSGRTYMKSLTLPGEEKKVVYIINYIYKLQLISVQHTHIL